MANKLYIKEHIPITCLDDLIECLYTRTDGYNGTYAQPTFLDKEFNQVECTARRRSFEDLLTLSKTYFPNTTEKDLMSTLKNLGIEFLFCNDIRKFVFQRNQAYKLTPEVFNMHLRQNFIYAEGTYTAEDLIKIYEQI